MILLTGILCLNTFIVGWLMGITKSRTYIIEAYKAGFRRALMMFNEPAVLPRDIRIVGGTDKNKP